MNTYQKNLTTGKIEMYFAKADYLALSVEKKKEIKSNFLWSNYNSCWVSRSKNNTHWAEEVAKSLNLTFQGETGEKLSFATQVEREQERAAERAERMEARAEKAHQEGQAAYNRAHEIGRMIPFGQPILVGHHSEGRHRRDLEKIDNAMRKSCEGSKKAEYYENRAGVAEYTANGAKFKNVNYLLNRIAECKVELRAIERGLAGNDLYSRETGEKLPDGTQISEERKNKLETKKAEETEKLDFFNVKLQEIGGGQMTAERLKDARPLYVKAKGEWWPLKSINRDTVTVLNSIGIAEWTRKFKFDVLKGLEAGQVTKVYDRDGKEVVPTIRYK